MLEQLFGSKTRVKVLRKFFAAPEKVWYVREMSRAIDSPINAVRREIGILATLGLVQETDYTPTVDADKAGAKLRKYYALDPHAILYPELQDLLAKARLLEQQAFIEDVKEKGGNIKVFLLTGQFTGAKDVGSDVLLVGDIKQRNLAQIVQRYENEFGFPIRYTVMGESEYTDRSHIMDKFLYSLFDADHVAVINEIE